MEQRSAASLQRYARAGGILYLFIIVVAMFTEFSRDSLIVHGNAAATAQHIMASATLWRVAFVGALLVYVCDLGVALILYVLLQRVDSALALAAAFFRVVYVPMVVVSELAYFAPVIILGHAAFLNGVDPGTLSSLAYLAIQFHNNGFSASLIFFAVHLLLVGYLIYRSQYFPKWLGVFVSLAAVSYLLDSVVLLLSPAVGATMFPILLVGFIGELSLCLWLIIKGVNLSRIDDGPRPSPT